LEDRRILIDTSVLIDHFRKKNKQLRITCLQERGILKILVGIQHANFEISPMSHEPFLDF
jgi:predicted nucleic acid-binding protein